MARMVTAQQRAEIARLTRQANRRIERATGGQLSALEYWMEKQTGAAKFSASSAGLTYEQAEAKLELLEQFRGLKSSKITSWKEMKRESVNKANETFGEMGYDLTDEELADILKQLDSKKRSDFYRAVNLVQAAKEKAGESWEGSSSEIAAAIAEKASYQEALERGLEAREERAKRKASR